MDRCDQDVWGNEENRKGRRGPKAGRRILILHGNLLFGHRVMEKKVCVSQNAGTSSYENSISQGKNGVKYR